MNPLDFLTPGINPGAPDYRQDLSQLLMQKQLQQPQQKPQGVFGKLDNFMGTPGGGFLMNLLAQSGYSKMPHSPLGAVGKAALMSSQQQQSKSQDELKKRLIEAQIGLYDSRASGGGLTPAGLREFEGMTVGLTPEEKEAARRVALGLEPRAGISADERIASDPALTALITKYEAELTEAREGAKSGVKSAADIKKTNQDRAQTLGVWEASRGPLVSALEGTITGPVVGLSPALTSPQQIADGAIAAVAPVLKQLFRAAGEGIFTDRDQQLLLEMVPDRSDHPEARKAKMKMIDAIIAAKLAPIEGGPSESPQQNNKPLSEMTDAELQEIINGNNR